MSRSVDERIVSMQFDNKQFESGVQTSLNTLDRLKKSLDLSGASKGLQDVNKAAKKCDLSPISNAVESVSLKFSAWYTVADQTLRNIVNLVESYAKRMFDAFAIDPIKTGLSEYETQIGAVQTILANTQSKGTNLDQVNSALDELNTYADKTIYNFTEMTRNIGTFTAAGVDLDKSVTSIKGIANLAAVSGSTSQQASTAMYQLSQALASGKVTLMDWNSVVNAGMGGQVFQDALKRTATQMGTNVDAMIKKYGSFRESLTQGEWLTAEVLTETLTQLSGAYSKAELMEQGYTEEQANQITELAKTAVDAATKVKTFSQLMDTLKEGVQSGWSQTWELIIGDFEEAKELWTGISDAVGGFISSTSDARNKLLSGALDSNWDKLVTKINEAGIETSTFEDKLKKCMKGHDVDVDKVIKEHGSLENAFKKGAVSSDILKEAVDGLGTSLVDLSSIEGELKKGNRGDDVKKAQEALKALGHDLGKTGADGIFGSKTEEAVKAFQELQGLEVTGIIDESTLDALEKATTKANKLGDSCDNLIDGVTELGGREIAIEGLKNIFEGLMSVVRPIKAAFTSIFPPMTSDRLLDLIKKFRDLTSKFKLSLPQMIKVRDTFKGLFSGVKIGWNIIKALVGGVVKLIGKFSGLGDGILEITGSWGKWLTGLSESIEETGFFSLAIEKVVNLLTPLINGLKKVGSFLKERLKAPGFEQMLDFFSGVWGFMSKIGQKIATFTKPLFDAIGSVFRTGDFNVLMDLFNGGVIAGILLGIKKFVDGLKSFTGEEGIFSNIKDILTSVKGCFEAWQNDLKANVLLKIAAAIGILALSLVVIASIDPKKLASALWAITALFGDLMGSMALFSKIGGAGKGAIKSAFVMIGMAAAVLILASACKKLSDLSWEEIAKGVVGVAALTAVVVASAKILGKGGKTVVKGTTQMVIMAWAISILGNACKKISSLSWEEMGRGLAGIAGMVAIMVVAVKAMSTKATTFVKGAGSMLVMSVSLSILAKTLGVIAAMSWKDLGKGLATIGILMAGLVVVSKAMSKGALSFVTGSGAMIVMAVALTALVGTMALASRMSWESITKGLISIAGAMLVIAVGLHAMKGTLGGSAALLVAAAAILALTPALMLLGSMSWENIGKGLAALAGAIIIIGVAGKILAPMAPAILKVSAAFAIFGVALALVGAGITLVGIGIGTLATAVSVGATAIVAGLSTIILGIADLIPALATKIGEGVIALAEALAGGIGGLAGAIKTIVLAILDVLVECIPEIADGLLKLITEVLASLVEYTPQIVDSIMSFIIGLIDGIAARLPELIQSVVNLVMQFFSGVVDAIKGVDVSTLLQGLGGLGIMSAIMAALNAVSLLVPGAMVGVLGMGAVVAELAIVLAAIGALAQIPGLDWLVNEGGELMASIGGALGGFVGSIIGGVAEGITASLPQIGTDLSNFMTNLTPFLDGAKLIDESVLTNVGTLVAIIAAISGASLLESITSFVTGTSSIDSFATQLVTFGTAIKDFSTEVAGIDTSGVTAAAEAGNAIATMASNLPNSGGVLGFFAGENDLSTFATQLKPFGTAIKDFSAEVTGINTDGVTAAAEAGLALATMASELPNSGGVLGFFAGENDLSTFAEQIKPFGTAIKDFAAEVTGINTDGVSAAAAAGKELATMASELPNSGGVLGFFAGENDLSTFADQITPFGTAIKNFSQEVTGIDTSSVSTATAAGLDIVNMANSISNEGGVVSWFTGDNSLGGFSDNIVEFGTAMKGFSDAVSGIKVTAVTTATSVGTAIVGMANTITADSVNNLGDLGKKLKTFSSNSGDFFTTIGTINTAALNSVSSSLTKLASVDTSGIESLMGSLKSFSVDMLDSFLESITTMGDRFRNAGEALITKLALGIKVRVPILSKVIKTLNTSMVDSLEDGRSDFYSAGEYLVTGFANGITASTWKAKAKAKAMAKAALEAAKNALDEHSPSREAYKIGAFFGEGFVNAIDDYGTKSRKAGARIAETAKLGLSGAIAKVRDIVENGIDSQPTIRPVLDLSAVSAGAGSINGMFDMSPSIGTMSNIRAINSMMNMRQNGMSNDDVVKAIKDLGSKMGKMSGDHYSIGDVSYDDNSTVSNAVRDLVRAAQIERRR